MSNFTIKGFTDELQRALHPALQAVQAQTVAQGDVNASSGAPVRVLTFDYAADFANPRNVNSQGQELIFLRRNSFPGARFDLRMGATLIPGFRPGCRLRVPGLFQEFQLTRSDAHGEQLATAQGADSPATTASEKVLVVSLAVVDKGAEYNEPDVHNETDGRLWPLLGDSTVVGGAAPDFVSFLTTTGASGRPVNYDEGHWFNPLGFRAFRVYLDTHTAGGDLTSLSLILWQRVPTTSGVNAFYALPLTQIDLVTPANSQYLIFDVDNPLASTRPVKSNASLYQPTMGGGDLTFQVVAFAPAGATAVGIAVDGVEFP